MNDREKAQVFVKHIENHLEKENPEWRDHQSVMCKFCGATIDEIYREFLERMGEIDKKAEALALSQKVLGEGIGNDSRN